MKDFENTIYYLICKKVGEKAEIVEFDSKEKVLAEFSRMLYVDNIEYVDYQKTLEAAEEIQLEMTQHNY